MPQQGSKRVSVALSNLSQRYENFEYIANNVLRDLSVAKESGQYYVYNNDRRREQTERANGTPAFMATWDVSTSTYSVKEHALKDVITDRDRVNIDSPPLQMDADTTEYLVDKLMLDFEYEAHQLLFTTTTFSNNTTLTSASSWKYHTTTSAPIQNVLSASSYITRHAGVKPNEAVMSIDVRDALKENQNVHERIKYVMKSIVTEDLLASLFDLKKVHVGTAIYNASGEGESADNTDIWGDDCLIAYFDPNPRLKTKTAAVNLRMNGYKRPWQVKKWREDDIDGDYIQVQTWFKPKAISTVSGYLIKSAAL